MDIDGQAISRILYSGSGALTPDRIMAIYLAVPVMKTETDLLRSTRNCSPDADRQSEVKTGRLFSFLFDLAPGGVYPASDITVGAVVSYTAISPLSRYLQGDVGTVSFLWHFPFSAHYCGSPRHYTGAPCPMESGLSSPPARTLKRPSRRNGHPLQPPISNNYDRQWRLTRPVQYTAAETAGYDAIGFAGVMNDLRR